MHLFRAYLLVVAASAWCVSAQEVASLGVATASAPAASPVAPVAASVAAPAAPTAAGAAAASEPNDVPKEAVTLLCLVNKQRATQGLSALGYDHDLELCAQGHSSDMADHRLLSHTGSDGSSPGQRISGSGYSGSTTAENVAMASWDLNKVMDMWIASPGHYANIMDPNMTHFGCGMVEGADGQVYFTQAFGGDGRAHSFPLCPDLSKPAAAPAAMPVVVPAAVWAAEGTQPYYAN